MRYSESPEFTVTRCAGARTIGASMSAGGTGSSTGGADSGLIETVSGTSEGGSASATATGCGPGSDDAFAGSGEEATSESSTAASRRGDGAGCSSGDASCPALDNIVSGARPVSATESGSSRSTTVVSSAGAERIGATPRMTPPVGDNECRANDPADDQPPTSNEPGSALSRPVDNRTAPGSICLRSLRRFPILFL